MRLLSCNLKTLFCWVSGLLVGFGFLPAVQAASYWNDYIPPELAYADDLAQVVALPAQVNINQDSLAIIKTLPGFTETLALKAIRHRPYADFQDCYKRLPDQGDKTVRLLLQQLQPKLRFK